MNETHVLTDTVVARPDSRTLWLRLAQSAALPLALNVFYGVSLAMNSDPWARTSSSGLIVMVAAALTTATILAALRARNQRIEYSATELTVTNLLGRRSVIARRSIEHAVIVRTFPVRQRARTILVVIDTAGRRVLCIDSERWPIGDLTALAAELVQPVESDLAAPGLDDLRQRFPGAVPWWIAFPSALTIARLALAIAVIAAWAGITTLIAGS